MRAVLKFQSRVKGLFALRKTLKVLINSICMVERDPDNEFGESCSLIKNLRVGCFGSSGHHKCLIISKKPMLFPNNMLHNRELTM